MKSVAPYLILVGPDEEIDETLMKEDTHIVPAFNESDFKRKYNEANDSRSHGGTVFACYWWNAKEGQYDLMDVNVHQF